MVIEKKKVATKTVKKTVSKPKTISKKTATKTAAKTTKAPAKKAVVKKAPTKSKTVVNTTKSVVKKSASSKTVLSNLKTEILDEVTPFLKKINVPKIKKEVTVEINDILDYEFNKLKSELTSKTTSTSKDFKKIISDLEEKLLEGLKENATIKKQMSTLKKVAFSDLQKELESTIVSKFKQATKGSQDLFKKTEKEIELVKHTLSKIDVNSVEKKLTTLEKDFTKLRKDLDIHDEEALAEMKKEEIKQAQFIVNKVNEIIERVNKFEILFKKDQEKVFAKFEGGVETQFEKIEKKIRQELLHRVSLELEANHQDYKNAEKKKDLDLASFKTEIATHVKDYIVALDKELKALKIKDSDLNLKETKFMEKVKTQITTDVSRLEEKLSAFKKESDEILKKLDSKKEKKLFNDEIKKTLDKTRQDIKEDLKTQLKNSKESVIKLGIESKESLRTMSEEVEKKLVDELDVFRSNAKSELSTVIDEIKSYEEILTNKFQEFETEKESLDVERVALNEKVTKFLEEQKKSLESETQVIVDEKNLLNERVNKFLEDQKKKLESETQLVNDEREVLANEREELKEKFDIAIADVKANVSKVLEDFTHENKDIEDALNNLVKQKLSEQVDSFNEMFNTYLSDFENKLKEKDVELDLKVSKFTDLDKKVEETLSSQVNSVSQHLIKLSSEQDVLKNDLTAKIEEKLITASKFFRKDYDEHLEKFDTSLKTKEDEYLKKLLFVEKEKTETVTELKKFKEELGLLTKNYVGSMTAQLEKIKTEEKNFEKEKDLFVGEIEANTKARKLELDDYAKELEKRVEGVIVGQQERFEKHEDTFREIFNEKLSKFSEFQKAKLESIEKKFVDKNLKYIESRVEASISELKIIEESVGAKLGAMELKFKEFESREDTMAEDISTFENTVNERIEERLMGLEQSLNKRFLGLDEQFTNFKGIVVDEVEDLMKEVQSVVSNKLETVDTHINKINFAGSEVVKRLRNFDEAHGTLQKELTFVRDDINDLRVKTSTTPTITHQKTPDLISYMSEYEQNLVHLIKSLKDSNIRDRDILETLTKKGHPFFYVKMVMSQFDLIK